MFRILHHFFANFCLRLVSRSYNMGGEIQKFDIQIWGVNQFFPFFFLIVAVYISHRPRVVLPWSWSALWFSGSPWHFTNIFKAPKTVLFFIPALMSTLPLITQLPDVGSQNNAAVSVIFVWHVGETLGIFQHGGGSLLHRHFSFKKLYILEATKYIFWITYVISMFFVVNVV